MKDIMIFAHRGASGYAPDNTLEAFELAIKLGTSYIESDVKLTRDHHLVFFHDTFAFHGIYRCPVSLISLKRLQSINLGNGARVPKVEEIFAYFQGQSLTWSIDAKGKNQGAELMHLAKKYQILDHLFIAGEGYHIKKRWEQVGLPSDHYIWSIRERKIKQLGAEQIVKKCHELGIRILNVKLAWLTFQLRDAIKTGDIRLFIWDCHKEEDIRNALRFKPDAIYSNFPDVAIKVAHS